MERPLDRRCLCRIYESLDKDGDGILNAAELNGLLERIGMEKASPQEISDMLVSFKENARKGSSSLTSEESVFKANTQKGFYSLTFEEFVAFCESLLAEEESMDADEKIQLLRDAFRVYDENEDGFISAEELQRVLCSLGFTEGQQISVCHTMICRFDKDFNGLLDFSEFQSMMMI